MIVKKVNWISKDAAEAEVWLTDGTYEALCFSQPFELEEGDKVSDCLHAFDTQEVMMQETQKNCFHRISDSFDYSVEGILIDKKMGIVKIGGFKIELEEHSIPKDLKEGAYISFKCARLDIW